MKMWFMFLLLHRNGHSQFKLKILRPNFPNSIVFPWFGYQKFSVSTCSAASNIRCIISLRIKPMLSALPSSNSIFLGFLDFPRKVERKFDSFVLK